MPIHLFPYTFRLYTIFWRPFALMELPFWKAPIEEKGMKCWKGLWIELVYLSEIISGKTHPINAEYSFHIKGTFSGFFQSLMPAIWPMVCSFESNKFNENKFCSQHCWIALSYGFSFIGTPTKFANVTHEKEGRMWWRIKVDKRQFGIYEWKLAQLLVSQNFSNIVLNKL